MTRAGAGGATPTTFATGYLYADGHHGQRGRRPGPSRPGTRTRTRDTPIVDKSCCVLMANNEILLDLLEQGEVERARDVVALPVWAAKGYGVKAVNPGGVAAWKWGKDAKILSQPVEGYQLSPAVIIAHRRDRRWFEPAASAPPPLQQPGRAGCLATTLETMKVLEGHRAHMAHLQLHAYGGEDWGTLRPSASKIAEYFNAIRTSPPTRARSSSATR